MIGNGNLYADNFKSFYVQVVCNDLKSMNPFVCRLYLAEIQDGLFTRVGPVAYRSIGRSAFVQIDDVSPSMSLLLFVEWTKRLKREDIDVVQAFSCVC